MPEHVTDTVRINYLDQGNGPPVILLHSSGASGRQWRKLIEDYGNRYRFLAPDLIGYGKTSSLSTAPYSTEQEVALVEALLNEADQPVHLVGHSFGGAVALDAALVLGDRISSVTAIEPVLFQTLKSAGDLEAWAEIEAVAKNHIRHVEAGDTNTAADEFMDYWIGARAWAAMPDQTRAYIIATMPKIADEWRVILTRDRAPETYKAIMAPVRLLRGTETTLAARCVTDVLSRALPSAELIEIDDAGHLSPITHPEAVNPLIVGGLPAP